MTKSEYRAYIQSEDWQCRRKAFLADVFVCASCRIPRFAAVLAYDQDFNVHHRNYQNVGDELDSDLQALCRRCHEIETFGKSSLVEAAETKLQIGDYLAAKSDSYGEGFNDAMEWIIYLEGLRQQAVGV